MNWILLILGGLFEIGFTSSLGKAKETTGSEMYMWYAAFAVCLVVSMALLIKATQTLPLGTAYAVWTGIGAVGTVILGIILLKEPYDLYRMLFIFLIIIGIVGLRVLK